MTTFVTRETICWSDEIKCDVGAGGETCFTMEA